MTQFFNVQMNLQETPQVQVEQSGTLSSEVSSSGSKESFNSFLQKVLPEQNTASSLSLEKIKQSNSGRLPASNNTPTDSSIFANKFSEENSTATIDQQTSTSPESSLPLEQAIFNDPAKLITPLPNGQPSQHNIDTLMPLASSGQQVPNKTDTLIAPATTGQQVLNETDTLIVPATTGQQVANGTYTLIVPTTTDQQVATGTDTLIVPATTGQQVPNETDTLIVPTTTGQQVANGTDTLIAPATTGQQVPSETDTLIAPATTGQQVPNETDTPIVSATTAQPTLSARPGETTPIIQKETPAFFNPSTGELSEKIYQNETLNPFNGQSNNKLNGFQDTPSFANNTKSLTDLQNITTQTNNTSQQRIYSELTLPTGTTQSQQVITPQQGALLDRLQSIINNGNETGTLSIKNVTLLNSDDSLRSQLAQLTPRGDVILTSNDAAEKLTTRNDNSFTVLEEGVFAPSLRTQQQSLSGIRHDSNQQFFNAKIQPQNNINDSSNSATSQQNDGMNQQGSEFKQLSSLTNKTETGAPFTLQGTTTADPLSTQISTEAKTTILPSGTLLHDQEVIQQLVDRFKVNRRQLESKIQLKLHPAELGKMEIDLTVKEGSIRANVVAQSQHVQEIVERNIAKLKTVLEQQGFNVEEIIVTSESEMVGSFDLFDQQLSQNDSSTFFKNKNNSENNTPFVMDEFQDSYIDASSGVNVKV